MLKPCISFSEATGALAQAGKSWEILGENRLEKPNWDKWLGWNSQLDMGNHGNI